MALAPAAVALAPAAAFLTPKAFLAVPVFAAGAARPSLNFRSGLSKAGAFAADNFLSTFADSFCNACVSTDLAARSACAAAFFATASRSTL